MREVSDLRLKIDSQNRRFKWQDPELIDLTGRQQRAQGACGFGTGNTNCDVGSDAFICINGIAGWK